VKSEYYVVQLAVALSRGETKKEFDTRLANMQAHCIDRREQIFDEPCPSNCVDCSFFSKNQGCCHPSDF
jgi:hypothetical protein